MLRNIEGNYILDTTASQTWDVCRHSITPSHLGKEAVEVLLKENLDEFIIGSQIIYKK
jgi:hypothetical protein